ncbi:hypothetical protein [[Scytonema hofmanni] UTEX B 1581]|uniref:hypothetical protein n=1 Tax=[Scytonema hofmanni] UTEX B 1581 TaxID=379535 RepID=UPI0004B577A6|nr:hypothetical protein [[Scytonema hofmanni] UTEX B 1581]
MYSRNLSGVILLLLGYCLQLSDRKPGICGKSGEIPPQLYHVRFIAHIVETLHVTEPLACAG